MDEIGPLAAQLEKIRGVLEDSKNCSSQYSRAVLIATSMKLADGLGLKQKIFGSL